MKKLAIIGSTGMLGQPVTKEFINAGFEVSLLVRNPDKARGLFGPNVRIVKGSLSALNSVKEVLSGQDVVYLNLSVTQTSSKKDFQPEREGLLNLLQVSKEVGIKRIGYLSSLIQFYTELNWWVFDIKRDAIVQIKESGIPYSIFYPSTFMESFDKGAYRQGNTISLAGNSRFPMYLIAGSDYGKQVVKAFEMNTGNHEYIIQGPEGFIADDAAKFFVRNYSKSKLKIVKIPYLVLKFMGYFSNKFSYGANVVDALNNYPEKFEAEQTWQELGKPQLKFLDYVKNA